MSEIVEPGWSRRANHMSSRWRALGGKLDVTPEDELRFVPHGVDRATGGLTWRARRDEIGGVDVEPRSLKHNLGGLSRKQLRVTLTDGTAHFFVVNKLADIVGPLRVWVAHGG
jgi:hypothetical protein